jgi:hypothetical protein
MLNYKGRRFVQLLDGGQLSLAVHLSLLPSKNLHRSRLKPVSQPPANILTRPGR